MALDVELYRRTLYNNSRRISVIDIHPAGATHTIVFVHGYGGNALQWLYQLRYFGQYVRVIAPDLRGHGISDDDYALPYTMDSLVDDLEHVLDALEVQSAFSLIAHSFGGAVATEYALRHPQNISGMVLVGVPSRFILRPIIVQLMNTIPDPLFSYIARKIGALLYAPLRTLKPMHASVMSVWRGDERFPQLRVPTLVILGHRDTVFLRSQYEDVPRSIPRAQQVVISVSAHLVQLERPDAVNRAIRRFLLATTTPSLPTTTPERQSGNGQQTAQSALTFAHPQQGRLVNMPWLQHYDDSVPETLPLPKQPLHGMLSNAAIEYPHRAALIFFNQKIGYRELDYGSNRFAHALRSLGVLQGDRVSVILPNIPQCVVAFYGILKIGAIAVLGSPLSNEAEIHHQLQDSSSSILITLSSYRTLAMHACRDTQVQHIIYTDVREYLPMQQRVLLASLIENTPSHRTRIGSTVQETPQLLEAQDENTEHTKRREHNFQHLLRRQPTTPSHASVSSEQLALIQYTSGTTDTPKGVMLSHGNLLINVAQVRHWVPKAQRGREVILGVLPLSHSYGITDTMNLSIAMAGSLLMMPADRIDQIMQAIKRHAPSIFPGVPAMYLAIANYPKVRSYGVAAIRYCTCGSAPLPIEAQEAFEKLTKGYLVEGYGLTEASPVTHSNPFQGERRVGSIGLPMSGTNARIVNVQTTVPLPPGEVGELLIQGPQVMQGYWNMPDETAQVLRSGWLHTGDLARMDEDGFFTIVDRKKDLILSGTYNIYPRDVEEVLYEHPKVLEAAVVSTGSATSSYIKAVVVLKRGEQATADELLALCRERLDGYKVPKQIEFRKELPKNLVGKVLRRLLIEA
jgi:long-chain acyl-CoA synthetase